MNSFQRVIKYCAIALAVLISVSIIGGICSALFGVTHSIPNKKEKSVSFSKEFEDIKSLKIEGLTADVEILVGDKFRVDTKEVSEKLEVTRKANGTLCIESSDDVFSHMFNRDNWNSKSKIIIYLPENFIAKEVLIGSGAGKVNIEKLTTDWLKVDAGAGNIEGSNIVASEVEIDGGVGNITLSDVEFTDADIDSGVGDINISGKLYGDNDLDCGVGNVKLSIDASIEEYNLYIDSGIGSARVNGDNLGDTDYRGSNAKHKIDIDGGVGSIDIEFTQDK